eukprot:UN02213
MEYLQMQSSNADIIPHFDSHTITNEERLKRWALKIKQNKYFIIFYFLLIIANLIVLIYEIAHGGERIFVLVFEALITFMFIMEIFIDISVQGKDYWYQWTNVADFIVCGLCTIFFIVFALDSAPEDMGSYLDSILICLRYGFQFIRLIRFALQGH